MRHTALILLMVWTCPSMAQSVGVASSASAPATQGPQDAGPLVDLARGAMLEYLKNRTPPDRQTVPTQLQHFHDVKCGAAVAIRLEGQLKAQAFANSDSLCRNVIA